MSLYDPKPGVLASFDKFLLLKIRVLVSLLPFSDSLLDFPHPSGGRDRSGVALDRAVVSPAGLLGQSVALFPIIN
jgi:hypothetical protein